MKRLFEELNSEREENYKLKSFLQNIREREKSDYKVQSTLGGEI
jgi:hypothetical protein